MKIFVFLTLIFTLGVWIAMSPKAFTEDLPEIQFEKYELPNGLDVILHEDHSIPMVAVNIWYHVGSKNEKPGRTGFAHLFEHMMFQGSKHHDKEYFEPLEKVGASINGSTNEDRTNYWENVPSNYLELALWLEADRMGFLLPAMTQKKLDNQRDVVKNERRQSYENQPYGKAFDMLPTLLYPGNHPYSWPVIGSMADLSAANVEDVSEFFRTYYAPNNASLCIAGDFDPAQAKKLVEKYFGSIPPGPAVDRLTSWMPELENVRRATIQDNVKLPRVYYAWHTPALFNPSDAELDLLANILASGKTSRLYKALVYDKQIAQDVEAYQASQELSSTFNIVVTAREGHSLAELEQAVEEELSKIFKNGVTAQELRNAQTTYETGFVRSLQNIGGFGGRADRLNTYNTYLNDPGKFQWDLNRYLKVTAEDVWNTTKQYLDFDRSAILHVVPQGSLTAEKIEADRSKEPQGGPEPSFQPPTIQTGKLSNGMEILLVEDHRLPLIQTNIVIKSGWASDPADKPGAASLTAELLDEGTTTRNALEISEEAKSIGAILGTSSFFDGSQIRLNVLKKNFDKGLVLMSDIVLNPTFPAEELERQRQIYLGRIQQESKEPFVSAFKIYQRALYGEDHPYAQPYTGSGTEESIGAIQRADLVQYYKNFYLPNNGAVIIVGDISLEEAKAKLENAFKGWKTGDVKQTEIRPPKPPEKTRIYLVDKTAAPQSMVIVGHLGIRRNDPQYVAVDVLNNAFGGQFSSRLNLNLREEKGYTYGAGSLFLSTRAVGPFAVYAPVQTQNTREAIIEILKELKELTQTRPLTEEELAASKSNLIKGFPQQFQTYSSIAGQLGEIVIYDLPKDEWSRYLQEVNSMGTEQVHAATKEHIHPQILTIVVVGDRQQIEKDIRDLNLGEVIAMDL